MEKHEWDARLFDHMMNAYSAICPLTDREMEYLKARFIYPEKFWKIANHYNNNKKTWSSKRDGDKLRQIMNQETARREYLALLYNLME